MDMDSYLVARELEVLVTLFSCGRNTIKIMVRLMAKEINYLESMNVARKKYIETVFFAAGLQKHHNLQ